MEKLRRLYLPQEYHVPADKGSSGMLFDASRSRKDIGAEIHNVHVTPDTLLWDNTQPESEAALRKFNQNRQRRMLSAVLRCSDSRLIIPISISVELPSIATANEKDPYNGLFQDERINNIVVLAHHDGDTVEDGKQPEGCGGLAAAAAGVSGDEGLPKYIERIKHPDPLIQAWWSAADVALRTDKPVIAATQDHLSGDIYTIATFLNHGRTVHSALPPIYLQPEFYNPAVIYQYGIPVLDPSKIPGNFDEFFEEQHEELVDLNNNYRGLRTAQKHQNPGVLFITTDIRSKRVKYTNTFRLPGTAFGIHVARENVEGTKVVNPEHFLQALDQAEYPIDHFDINTVIIETASIETSKDLAYHFLTRPKNDAWVHSGEDRNIVITGITGGTIDDIDYYRVA